MDKLNLSDVELSFVTQELERLTGLHFPIDRKKEIHRGLSKLQSRLGLETVVQLLNELRKPESKILNPKILASCFTVGETHFYRDHFVFDELSDWLIRWAASPENQTKDFRIWCAGCSTGEEAYTLASLFIRSWTDSQRQRLKLIASDINLDSLERAKAGVYGSWSFRDVPKYFKRQFFSQTSEEKWRVKKEVKTLVDFRSVNLISDDYPEGPFEVILCRNVIMYFTHDTARAIVQRLLSRLKPGGLLFVAAAEAWLVENCDTLPWGAGCYIKAQGPENAEESILDWRASPVPALLRPAAESEKKASEPSQEAEDLARAQELAGLGDLEQAYEICQQILQADPQRAQAYRFKARLLDRLGRYQEAASSLNNALFLEPQSFSDHVLMGSLLERAGNKQGAIQVFRGALKLIKQGVIFDDEKSSEWLEESLKSSIERLENA